MHADFVHLYSNSVPLILLGTFVLAAGARRFLYSTLVIALASGLGVWFFGDPDSVVVGASGVIYGYLGLLMARGAQEFESDSVRAGEIRIGGMSSNTASNMVESLALAALTISDSGSPPASPARCSLDPCLPRSTGFAPVRSPLGPPAG